jgi:hypothetical protein
VLDLLIDILAAHRATILIARDRVTGPVRWRVIAFAYRRHHGNRFSIRKPYGPHVDQMVTDDPDPPKLAYFMHCLWCLGLWISIALVAVTLVTPRGAAVAKRALALSSALALIDEIVSE